MFVNRYLNLPATSRQVQIKALDTTSCYAFSQLIKIKHKLFNVMRKFLLFIFSCIFVFKLTAQTPQVEIEGIKYRYDTIEHVQTGPGTFYTKIHIPEYKTGTSTMGLYCYFLVADLKNPWLKYEVVLSGDTLTGLERPSAMAARKSYAGHKLFSGTNGDFYDTGSQLGLSVNGSMVKGEISRSFPGSTRPLFGINETKKPFIDIMKYSGSLKTGTTTTVIDNVNTARGENQLILFNSFRGKNTGSNEYGTEVIIRIKEGNNWRVNNKITGVVEEVRINKTGASIPKGKAVLSAHGTKAAVLNTLNIGDEVEVTLNVNLPNSTNLYPALTEAVGGDRWILRNSTYYGTNWTDRHPRTCIGFSQDSARVIQMVIDGRWDASNGVTTYQCADIIKLAGAANALNLDGGGSSAMIVQGAPVNRTSDGNERAVSNGIFTVSTAPAGNCTSVNLLPDKLNVQFGESTRFYVVQYNEYGDVHDWKTNNGVNFSIKGNIGTINSSGVFTANGEGGTAWIIAEANGAKDSTFVTMRDIKRINIRQKLLVIDNRNPYLYKVSAYDASDKETTLPNHLLQWKILDEKIGKISEEGVFTGLQNGKTKIIGRFNENIADTVDVSVEIGENNVTLDDFSDAASWVWNSNEGYVDNVTLKNVDINNEKLLEVIYSFTYKNRTAFVLLQKDLLVYGMPDSVELTVKFPKNRYSLFYTTQVSGAGMFTDPFTHDGTMKKFPSLFADLSQELYPATVKTLRLQIERMAAYKSSTVYTDTIYLKSLNVIYPTKTQTGIGYTKKPSSDLKIFPSPANDIIRIVAETPEVVTNYEISIFNLAGQKMLTEMNKTSVTGILFDKNLMIDNFPDGLYILKLKLNDKTYHNSFLVKKNP